MKFYSEKGTRLIWDESLYVEANGSKIFPSSNYRSPWCWLSNCFENPMDSSKESSNEGTIITSAPLLYMSVAVRRSAMLCWLSGWELNIPGTESCSFLLHISLYAFYLFLLWNEWTRTKLNWAELSGMNIRMERKKWRRRKFEWNLKKKMLTGASI